MDFETLIKETDALTYLNALKVTHTEIKDCVSEIEQLAGYLNNTVEKSRKLIRKADNQYRAVARIVHQGQTPFATDIEVQETMEDIEKLMGSTDD